jgi:hypothetical protein
MITTIKLLKSFVFNDEQDKRMFCPLEFNLYLSKEK